MSEAMNDLQTSGKPAKSSSDQKLAQTHFRWIWILCACVLLLGGAAFFLSRRAGAPSSRGKQPSAPPALAVATVAARKGDIGVSVNALGAGTPVYTVSVKRREDW